ncbi:polysaccharide biosynthesis/export family protein [Emcibacter sp. SYSU 3D8]|uniref:polysaccharide biosynthesis/export family protein n=1 Tax=Emcibacter sp. SYSU 3D8 TaxID=3133969 RepID=UPI0031FF1B5F
MLAAIAMLFVSATAALANDPSGYRLGAGDEVRVTVFNHADLSGQFTVSGDGVIALPLVGDIKAGGMTPQEVESGIKDALEPDFLKNASVNVDVLNYRPFYILGEVNKPGSYPYVSGMKVVNAVALSGGYTVRASQGKIFIERGGQQKVPADPQTQVLPGDIVHVPERFF